MKKTKPEMETKNSVKTVDNMLGLLMLFVVASIVYSTYVISSGTDGWIPKAMVAPQAMFAALVAIKKFSK